MNRKMQHLCVWSGILFASLFGIGWCLIGGYLPPHPPTLTDNEIAAIYQVNTNQIRVGLVISMLGTGFLMPWVAVISAQMRRIEGWKYPVLSHTQLGAGTLGVLILFLPMMIWTVVAFRPERSPEIMLAISDFGFLLLLMTFPLAFIQNLVIGIAILMDKRAKPLFARWVGFLNLWVCFLFLPAGLMSFFKTGPFAWTGLIAFWIPLVIFFIWVVVMFFALRKAIDTPECADDFPA